MGGAHQDKKSATNWHELHEKNRETRARACPCLMHSVLIRGLLLVFGKGLERQVSCVLSPLSSCTPIQIIL
jgi:hypothetical protein